MIDITFRTFTAQEFDHSTHTLVKNTLSKLYPHIRASHRAEALAAGFGFNTNYSFLEHLNATLAADRSFTIRIDNIAFQARLLSFGYLPVQSFAPVIDAIFGDVQVENSAATAGLYDEIQTVVAGQDLQAMSDALEGYLSNSIRGLAYGIRRDVLEGYCGRLVALSSAFQRGIAPENLCGIADPNMWSLFASLAESGDLKLSPPNTAKLKRAVMAQYTVYGMAVIADLRGLARKLAFPILQAEALLHYADVKKNASKRTPDLSEAFRAEMIKQFRSDPEMVVIAGDAEDEAEISPS